MLNCWIAKAHRLPTLILSDDAKGLLTAGFTDAELSSRRGGKPLQHWEEGMPITRYFVERLTPHNEVWMIRFDDEESGPYRSQSEAVLFAIEAAERHNEHGEKGQVVVVAPTWTCDQDISRGSW